MNTRANRRKKKFFRMGERARLCLNILMIPPQLYSGSRAARCVVPDVSHFIFSLHFSLHMLLSGALYLRMLTVSVHTMSQGKVFCVKEKISSRLEIFLFFPIGIKVSAKADGWMKKAKILYVHNVDTVFLFLFFLCKSAKNAAISKRN